MLHVLIVKKRVCLKDHNQTGSEAVAIKIAVVKETKDNEQRVAATPDTVKKYVSLGCEVHIEAGAGIGADCVDDAYKEAGAKIVKTAAEAIKGANILLCVQAPAESVLKGLAKDAFVIGILAPYENKAFIKACTTSKVSALAMELIPRITRAQAMDVLSSQANLAGYKAVLEAAAHFGRAFPMLMTAAGTVPPARAFVMGAGVAGLQAIATAKRLGAVVSATDVRPAAKEQVESLGGSFVAVEDEEFKQAETAGGYAKEMSKAYQKKQQALVEETMAKQDIVITTALIPGRPAPKLITEAMVKSMKPGSVIVDLAAPAGGNCELTEPGKVSEKHGVTIIGHLNMPSRLAASTAALYAKNLLNLVTLMIDSESGKLAVDWEDDIIKGVALNKGATVLQKDFVSGGAKTSTAAKKPAAKKTTTKKAASTAKKPAAKKSSSTTAKKPAAKKPAAKKTTSTAKKTAAKTTAAKKPAAKKTATKKPAAKKTTTKAKSKKPAAAKKS